MAMDTILPMADAPMASDRTQGFRFISDAGEVFQGMERHGGC